jgi:hypothetical protein
MGKLMVAEGLARDHLVRYQVHTNVARTDALLLILRVQVSKLSRV